MPDDWLERLESDVDSAELQADDPLYRIANDYDTHQHMREAIRRTLMREVRRAKGAELHELCLNMCLLSLWLALHDPDFANAVRQRLLDCIKTFNQAMLTVACSKKLAYARSIDPVPVDLTEKLRQADNAPPFTSRAWVL